LLVTFFLLNKTVLASPPVEKQVKHFESGTALQVHMIDGRTLDGKLISTSPSAFELAETGRASAETIQFADVASVNKMSASEKGKKAEASTCS
jgi:hypothetical protein